LFSYLSEFIKSLSYLVLYSTGSFPGGEAAGARSWPLTSV